MAIRPALYAPSPCGMTLWPGQRRGASALVRPGFSTSRGKAGGCGPPLQCLADGTRARP
jgi:hypothetical protein